MDGWILYQLDSDSIVRSSAQKNVAVMSFWGQHCLQVLPSIIYYNC